MNILETPFIVEFFFVISTFVFGVTLFAISPGINQIKKELLRMLPIKSFWRKVNRGLRFLKLNSYIDQKKKERLYSRT